MPAKASEGVLAPLLGEVLVLGPGRLNLAQQLGDVDAVQQLPQRLGDLTRGAAGPLVVRSLAAPA